MKKCMGCMEEYEEGLKICPCCGYEEGTGAAEVWHMAPGSILGGKYIVGKALGSGGFGVTYIGFDAELKRKVAIKEYLPGEFSTRVPGQTKVTIYEGDGKEQFQSGIEKFQEEAKRLARFQNIPGVVPIYDSLFENDTAYIVMEYIDGETLKKKMEREGRMSVESAMEIILPIAAALTEIHKEGIIHRDIAPDNIMVDKEGEVKLIDFGASRFATATHSMSLSVLIKEGYTPLEQYQSRGKQGPWTDVYALAAVLYTMLTGKAPQASMRRLEKDELKPPSKAGAKVSKNMDTAIMNALNLKAEERTPSMDVFAEELLSDKEVARRVVRKDKRDVGKWPLWVKGLTGAAAAVVVGFMVLVFAGIIKFENIALPNFVQEAGSVMVINVVNDTVDNAVAWAEGSKLEIQIVGREYSDEIEAGYVLEQSINSGASVAEGTTLELVVSAGAETVFMPSVEGLSMEDAVALLEEQGLVPDIEEVESMVTSGSIVSQSVAADEKLNKGSRVLLQVSTGMADIDDTVEVTMPNLVGMDYVKAQELLAELGLYLSKEREVYDSSVKKGGIVFQAVPEGITLRQGDSVTVTVSLGREQIRVADVQYMSEEEARQALAGAGLTVRTVYESSSIVKAGLVISQGTEADSLVDVGTEITITVSTGKEETSTTTPGSNQNAVSTATSTPTAIPTKTPTPESGAATPAPISAAVPTATPVPVSAAVSTATSAPVSKEWSEWVDSLPAGVTSDKYEIEERSIYEYREKQTSKPTTDSTLASNGWTLESTDVVYGDWGEWSEWSETEVSASDMREVEDQWWYQYRDYETTTGTQAEISGWTQTGSTPNYTDWSPWSDSQISGSSTREVQTQQVDNTLKPIYKTQWQYYKYIVSYYNSAQSTQKTYLWSANESDMWAKYNANSGKRDLEAHIEPSGWLDTQKTYQNGTVGYGDHWFNEVSQQVVTGYEQKTQWRYRDIWYTYYFERWTEWSQLSTEEVTGSATREVNKIHKWRYRNRTKTTYYTYSKWSDWTECGTESRGNSDTVQSRVKKTQYRYREK